MAISFADAFAQAYGQGMQRRWLQEQEEAERKRQNEGAKAVLELINSMGRQQANADASSGLNQAVSGFNALNPDKGAPDFAFQTPDLTQRPGGNWQSPTGSSSLAGLAQSTFGGTQPQSGSLVSLMPKVEAPKYDDASMYGTMAKALGQGVDYSLAASIIPGYFERQKAEKLKNEQPGAFKEERAFYTPEKQKEFRAADGYGEAHGPNRHGGGAQGTVNAQQIDGIVAQIKAENPDATYGEIFQYLYSAFGYGR